jgi:hypothetical protein
MDNQKTYTDEEITEDLKNPFDYGSPEYLAVVAKIKANREKYRQEQELNNLMKYRFTKGLDNEY